MNTRGEGQVNSHLSSNKVTVKRRNLEDMHRSKPEITDGKFEAHETKPGKKKGGRPPKDASERATERITLYCTEETKKFLLKHYGPSDKIREYLIENANYEGGRE